MKVTLGFRNRDAMVGFDDAARARRSHEVILADTLTTALGEVSQAIQDKMPGLASLPPNTGQTDEEVVEAFAAGVPIHYLHDQLKSDACFSGFVYVIAKPSDHEYLLALGSPYTRGDLLTIVAVVSESLQTWTVKRSLLNRERIS